jgi:hypothetical protein
MHGSRGVITICSGMAGGDLALRHVSDALTERLG